MKTASIWGQPTKRFYRFIHFVEATIRDRPLRFCVLGASDGRYVLPVVRFGHRCFAIDLDETALFGGYKLSPSGPISVSGLVARLRTEQLEALCEVVHGDFVSFKSKNPYDAVFTSGSVHYSDNLTYSIEEVFSGMMQYVRDGGFLFLEYLVTTPKKANSPRHYLSKKQVTEQFSPYSWQILHHRVSPEFLEEPNVENPLESYHVWGRLLVRRVIPSGKSLNQEKS